MAELLKVNNLVTQFKTESGLVKAVDGVTFKLKRDETLGLVGESGCGKSVSQLSVMQLISVPGEIAGGEFIFEGQDVSIQARIINLLEELQDSVKDLSYLFIAHDLSVVKHISDRVAVMYLGRIVEICSSRELYDNPLHPYTRALLSAIPIADPFVEETRERIILKGEVPSPLNPPPGCSFHPRCFMAIPECSEAIPPLRDVGNGHEVACIRV